MPTLNVLKSILEQTAKDRDTKVAAFQADLVKNPVKAFEWAEGAMRASARGQVADHYLGSIALWQELKAKDELGPDRPQTEEAVVEFIYKSILRTALQMNRTVRRSTSVMSNFMEAEIGAYYADLAADWEILCG